jgi:hypothetical protein
MSPYVVFIHIRTRGWIIDPSTSVNSWRRRVIALVTLDAQFPPGSASGLEEPRESHKTPRLLVMRVPHSVINGSRRRRLKPAMRMLKQAINRRKARGHRRVND